MSQTPGGPAHLFWERNAALRLGRAQDPRVEVSAAGGQHSAVGAERPPLHEDGDVTQLILPALVVEAEQDVGAVHRGLIGKHRALPPRHPELRVGLGRAVKAFSPVSELKDTAGKVSADQNEQEGLRGHPLTEARAGSTSLTNVRTRSRWGGRVPRGSHREAFRTEKPRPRRAGGQGHWGAEGTHSCCSKT